MSMVKLLEGLNDRQQEAVLTIEGPVMVIAGPGSGKTRVLTHRLAYMIAHGIKPYNIVALTFTNKAAREMKERIENLIGKHVKDLWIGTFHSIFARILRREGGRLGYEPDYSIYDKDDSKQLLKELIKSLDLPDELYKVNIVMSRISELKNSMITPEEYMRRSDLMFEDASAGREDFGKLYLTYQKRLRSANAMDFDDLLLNMYLILQHFPDALYKYQNLFEYIMIDEFQDTNKVQYEIAKKLAGIHENIFVVGDDAQSIYAFRGANLENIFSFQKDFPDHKLIRLEQNYRSTQTIVEAANNLIKHNTRQIHKRLWTTNPKGEKIRILRGEDESHEGRTIANDIFERVMRKHHKYSQFAILYRTNAQSRPIEEALRKQGIPYRIVGSLEFYKRKEIKDALAYLKVVINPHDDVSLLRIINLPPRGIGKTTLEKLQIYANEKNASLWETMKSAIKEKLFAERTLKAFDSFITMIEALRLKLKDNNAYDLAKEILERSGLIEHYKKVGKKDVEQKERIENIESLLAGIKDFSENEDESTLTAEEKELPQLVRYLQSISLMTDYDTAPENVDAVTLMTLHAAKGLEFDHVYISGVEEGFLPSYLSANDPEAIEEERRLFYVGITRARLSVTLTHARKRFRHGNEYYPEISRFVDELGDEVIDLSRSEPDVVVRQIEYSRKREVNTNRERSATTQTVALPLKNFVPDNPFSVKMGNIIVHNKFGIGKVIQIEGEGTQKVALIKFQDKTRKIMLKYAKLKILK